MYLSVCSCFETNVRVFMEQLCILFMRNVTQYSRLLIREAFKNYVNPPKLTRGENAETGNPNLEVLNVNLI